MDEKNKDLVVLNIVSVRDLLNALIYHAVRGEFRLVGNLEVLIETKLTDILEVTECLKRSGEVKNVS